MKSKTINKLMALSLGLIMLSSCTIEDEAISGRINVRSQVSINVNASGILIHNGERRVSGYYTRWDQYVFWSSSATFCLGDFVDGEFIGNCFYNDRVCDFTCQPNEGGYDYFSNNCPNQDPFNVPETAPACDDECPDPADIEMSTVPTEENSVPAIPIYEDDFSACNDPLVQNESYVTVQLPVQVRYVQENALPLHQQGNPHLPHADIASAIQSISQFPAEILIASGNYVGDFTVPAGVKLKGGYDPRNWQVGSGTTTIVNQQSSIAFAGGNMESAMENIHVVGATGSNDPTLNLQPQSRVSLYQLEITTSATTAAQNENYGNAIQAFGAVVRLEQSHLIGADHPHQLVSTGITSHQSCALIQNNIFMQLRSPILVSQGSAEIVQNQIVESYNGMEMDDSHSLIFANQMSLIPPVSGFTRAIQLDHQDQTRIWLNTFNLSSPNTWGIIEGSAAADPLELAGNQFNVAAGTGAPVLYVDYLLTSANPLAGNFLYDVNAMNQMTDIGFIGGNY